MSKSHAVVGLSHLQLAAVAADELCNGARQVRPRVLLQHAYGKVERSNLLYLLIGCIT